MSDGLPERLNPAGELLGYARTQALFSSAVTGSPDEMCAHLVRGSNKWAPGRRHHAHRAEGQVIDGGNVASQCRHGDYSEGSSCWRTSRKGGPGLCTAHKFT